MDKKTDFSNISLSIESKMGRDLHNRKNHLIEIFNNIIYDHLSNIVIVEDNFGKLLIPTDHQARSKFRYLLRK